MHSETRLEALLKAQDSLPFMREIELTKLVHTEPRIIDALCFFTDKLYKAPGNRSYMMTTCQDFVWTVLSALWDMGVISKKLDTLKQGEDAKPNHQSHPVGFEISGELLSKEKQIRSQNETIKTLKNDVSRLTKQLKARERAMEQSAAPTRTSIVEIPVISTEDVPVIPSPEPVNLLEAPDQERTILETPAFFDAMVMTDDQPDMCLEVSREVENLNMLLQAATEENARLRSEINRERSSTAPTTVPGGVEPILMSDLEPLTPTRVNLLRKRSSMAMELIFPSASPHDEPIEEGIETSARLMQTQRSAPSGKSTARLDALKFEEFELMKQREVEDELRMNDLLRQVIEKDEIIESLSREVERLGNNDSVSSSRRAATTSNAYREHETLLDTRTTDQSVVAILDERLCEVTELRSENDQLRLILMQFEQERIEFTSRIQFLEDNQFLQSDRPPVSSNPDSFRAVSEALSVIPMEGTDALCQAEIPVNLAWSRSDYIILTGVTDEPSSQTKWQQLLDAERVKTSQALDETRRVKMCLGELERQLTSMRLQLQKAGVKNEHIQAAMNHSGLTTLLLNARVGVFERLYQDALDRIARMNRIREQVHIIESREYIRKQTASTNEAGHLFEFRWDSSDRHITTQHQRLPHSAGGWHIPSTNDRWRIKSIDRAASLAPEQCLITRAMLPQTSQRRLI